MGDVTKALTVGLALAVLLAASPAGAQSAPFSYFAGLKKPADLNGLEGKLTWVGPQEEMVPWIAFTATGQAFDLSKFVPLRHAGVNYVNEKMMPRTFTASTDQLAALLKGVGAIAGVKAGGAEADGVLSFGLAQGGKVFEVILAHADATAVVSAIMTALQTNDTAFQLLHDLGCAGGVLGAPTATEVTASVGVARSGVRRNRSTGRYVQLITLKNNGGALPAPVSVIMAGLPGSVTVSNKAGTTCGITPTGLPFVSLLASLPAGKSADITVEFDNPDSLPIAYTSRVFAGPGPR